MKDIFSDINLPVKIEKKDKRFIASCPALDIFTQGETKEDAKNNLNEALNLFFISCSERGVLEEALKERGIKYCLPSVESDIKSVKRINKEDYINIPIAPFFSDNKYSQFAKNMVPNNRLFGS